MPFDSSGTYTPPTGAENAFPGKIIASATWNSIFTDLASAISSLAKYVAVEYVFDGGGQPLTAGFGGTLDIPFAGTIQQVTMFADVAGTAVIDIWKTTYAAAPPTNANSITAAAKPTLTAARKSVDATLTGWTKSVAVGDVMAFNLDSNNAIITKLTVALRIARN